MLTPPLYRVSRRIIDQNLVSCTWNRISKELDIVSICIIFPTISTFSSPRTGPRICIPTGSSIEASSFGVPAVNIGNRQKNRLAADSVLHVNYVPNEIESAIGNVLTPAYQDAAKACTNPYDPFRDGKNSFRIVKAVENALLNYSPAKLRIKRFETALQSDRWNTLLKESS